jgi:hypothetical protein
VGIAFLNTANYQGQCQKIGPRMETRWKEWEGKEENKGKKKKKKKRKKKKERKRKKNENENKKKK